IGPWKLLSPLPAKNPYMISLYILACCVVGFIAVALLKDRSAYDHTQEYDEEDVPEPQGAGRRAMGWLLTEGAPRRGASQTRASPAPIARGRREGAGACSGPAV